MRSPRTRALLGALCATAVALLGAGPASAAVTSSQITTPSDPTNLPLYETRLSGEASQTIEVAGRATAASPGEEVEIACFYNEGSTIKKRTIEDIEGEPVLLKVGATGTFSSAELTGGRRIPLGELDRSSPCVLRAVPPGTAATEPLSEFTGPRLGNAEVGLNETGPESHLVYDLYSQAVTPEGYFGWDSAGSCGPYGYVFDPTSLERQRPSYTADCEGNLYSSDESGDAASIVVDGHNAYDAEGQRGVHSGAPGESYLSEESHSYDAATGSLSQTWTESLARCVNGSGAPVDEARPGPSTCASFVPVGVKLVRTVTTGAGERQATVTDRFQSTDGSAHRISLSYGEEQNGFQDHPAYEFPGDSSFTERAAKSSASTGTTAPETIYFETDSEVAPLQGLANPIGAITLSAVPDVARFSTSDEVFELLYNERTVPATGALSFTQVLSQALSLEAAQKLAHQGEDALAGPAVAITSPANGTTVPTPSVAVGGTAADNYGIASLSVNGAAVAVSGSGVWSTTVALKPGANTITATATDHAGNTATTAITVNYVKPVNAEPTPVPATARVKSFHAGSNAVKVGVACQGAKGTTCTVLVTLTTVEKLSHGKVHGLAARLRSRTVTVGSRKVTIAAGKSETVTVPLNGTGRRLLARYHRLPLKALVQLIQADNKKKSAGAATLTLKAPARHKKHKRH